MKSMPNKFWISTVVIAFLIIIAAFCVAVLSYQSSIRTEKQINSLVDILGDLQIEEVIYE